MLIFKTLVRKVRTLVIKVVLPLFSRVATLFLAAFLEKAVQKAVDDAFQRDSRNVARYATKPPFDGYRKWLT